MERSTLRRSGPLKRNKGLKRGKPLRRKRFHPQYKPTPEAIASAEKRARQEFRLAAMEQRVCAVCGKATPYWDAHHVVERQYLSQNGHPIWVKRNSLRVCDQHSKDDCHGKHTRGTRRIKLRELTDDNIEYAFALLGLYAYDYLRQHYDGKDPRIERLKEEYGAGE
jgi:hypothetical protein